MYYHYLQLPASVFLLGLLFMPEDEDHMFLNTYNVVVTHKTVFFNFELYLQSCVYVCGFCTLTGAVIEY
jgi:hypothetical protein